MNSIEIFSVDGDAIGEVTFYDDPTNLYEERLQEQIAADCRECFRKWRLQDRPDMIRDMEVFGSVYNPDKIILDKDLRERLL